MKIVICSLAKDREYGEGITSAFLELGHEPHLFFIDEVFHPKLILFKSLSYLPLKKFSRKYWLFYKEIINKKFLKKIFYLKPDLFLSIGGEELNEETVRHIRDKFKIPAFVWVTDEPATLETRDPYRWFNFSAYSHLFFIDELWGKSLQLLPTSKTYLPFAGDSRAYYQVSKTKNIDVLFVGDLFPSFPHISSGFGRAKILSLLKKNNLITQALASNKMKVGYFFPELAGDKKILEIPPKEQLNLLINQAKIVVYINTMLLKTDFDAMLYNIIFSGSFVITDNKTNSRNLFQDNLVTFETPNELLEKINYYLPLEKERTLTSGNLLKLSTTKHTYKERANTILKNL